MSAKHQTMGAVIVAAALSAAACAGQNGVSDMVAAAAAAPASADRVARGQYLVTAIGCNDCHTPLKMGANGPEPDMSRFLSGHPEQIGALKPSAPQGDWLWAGNSTSTAFQGPWGISYAANLTPDQNTGLGIWTEDMFVNAIRTGKHMATARPIMPPMPWPAFRNFNDEDLKSIYAFLRTVKPVTNHVPDAEPAPAPPVPTN
jgi:mono/diheme cytochrome c family protein